MYRVIIVDDEIDVRSRLIEIMSNFKENFELIADYDNGIDALEGVQQLKPDLLITDIKIPYINGIELIEKVRLEQKLIKTIIISGYDEFDFAKKAIDLGVIGYITKPITIEDIAEVLKKVKENLDDEYLQDKNIKVLQHFQQESLPIMRENTIRLLLSTNSITETLQSRLDYVNVSYAYEYLVVLVFAFDKIVANYDYSDYENTLTMLKKTLTDSIEDVCESFDITNRNDKVIVFIKSNDMFNLNDIEGYLSTVLLKVNRFATIHISVGVSQISKGNHNFKNLYIDAKEALEYRSLIGGESVLVYDNLAIENHKELDIESKTFADLEYYIKYDTLENTKNIISNIYDMLNRETGKEKLFYINSEIINTIVKACNDQTLLFKNYKTYHEMFKYLESYAKPSDVVTYMYNLAKEVKMINDNAKVSSISKNFDLILRYTNIHFKDQDLSMQNVADAVNLSVSYVSALFKKEMNTTFVKYLTTLKIEEAKEQLKYSNKKIVEISEELGYVEPYYFSHCFKKYTGLSPRDFRKNEKTI